MHERITSPAGLARASASALPRLLLQECCSAVEEGSGDEVHTSRSALGTNIGFSSCRALPSSSESVSYSELSSCKGKAA